MTVFIALGIWLGGGFLFALLLGAVLRFSKQNEGEELRVIWHWQAARLSAQPPNPETESTAAPSTRPECAAQFLSHTRVGPIVFAEPLKRLVPELDNGPSDTTMLRAWTLRDSWGLAGSCPRLRNNLRNSVYHGDMSDPAVTQSDMCSIRP